MILKKSLITGQVTFEYFILFSVVVSLSLLSLSSFFPRIRDIIQGNVTNTGYAQRAIEAIVIADEKWPEPIN